MRQLNLLCFLLFISLRVISMPCIGCSGHPIANADSKVRVGNSSVNLYQIGLLSSEVTIEESQEDDSEHKLLPLSSACTTSSICFSLFFPHQVQSLLSTQAINKTNKRLFARFRNLRI